MAKKTIEVVIDDLDDVELEMGEGETVKFSLDGVHYEIDLSDKNAEGMRGDFAKYVDVAKKVGGRKQAKATPVSGERTRSSDEKKQIRDWANSNGYTVGDRGRIPQDVMDAYDNVH